MQSPLLPSPITYTSSSPHHTAANSPTTFPSQHPASQSSSPLPPHKPTKSTQIHLAPYAYCQLLINRQCDVPYENPPHLAPSFPIIVSSPETNCNAAQPTTSDARQDAQHGHTAAWYQSATAPTLSIIRPSSAQLLHYQISVPVNFGLIT